MKTATHRASLAVGILAVFSLPGCGDDSGTPGDSAPPPGADAAADVPRGEQVGLPDSAADSEPDAGTSDEAAPIEAGAIEAPSVAVAAEVASPTDAAAPTSCTILATLKSLRPDGGMPFPDSALPSTHRFSLLLDWAAGTAVTGSGGTSNKVDLVRAAGEWTTQGALVLATSIATNWPKDGTTSMGRPYVSYGQIALHPTADGCAGRATGKYLGVSGDMLFDVPFEAELVGSVDSTGPELSVLPAMNAIHPLDLEAVATGELLPPGTSARWVSTDGTVVPMTSLPPDGALGISGFLIGDWSLAFASSYRLDILPAAMDLAGNLTAQLPVLATITGPGFFAQDGFEGPVDALLGGGVKVVDGTSLPIPVGKKAIRFAPSSYGTSTDTTCQDRFTARLAVAPTAKTVKLSALSYRSSYSAPFVGWLRLAVPNGAVSDFGMYGMTSKATSQPNPWSGPLPGADVNTYGDLTRVELPLPAGTAGEVIFDLYRFCMEPGLPGDGIIIDELRVE